MGFERSTIKLSWPPGHQFGPDPDGGDGFEVSMDRLPIGDMLAVMELADLGQGIKAQKGALDSLLQTIHAHLRCWNLERSGQPVSHELGEPASWVEVDGRWVRTPPTGLYAQDLDVILAIADGWIEAATSVDNPLPQPSPNGVLSPELSERMAALSASLGPSPGPD